MRLCISYQFALSSIPINPKQFLDLKWSIPFGKRNHTSERCCVFKFALLLSSKCRKTHLLHQWRTNRWMNEWTDEWKKKSNLQLGSRILECVFTCFVLFSHSYILFYSTVISLHCNVKKMVSKWLWASKFWNH